MPAILSVPNIFKGHSWKIYFILIAISITGGLEAIYGIAQKFIGVEALATWQDPDDIKAGRIMSRVYGTLEPFNPNLLAGYLLAVFPCAFGLGTVSLFKKQWHWTVLFYILSLAVLACIVFTGSRGAYIGVALMVASIYLAAGHMIWHEFNQSKYCRLLKLFWILSGIGAVLAVVMGIMAIPALHDRNYVYFYT